CGPWRMPSSPQTASIAPCIRAMSSEENAPRSSIAAPCRGHLTLTVIMASHAIRARPVVEPRNTHTSRLFAYYLIFGFPDSTTYSTIASGRNIVGDRRERLTVGWRAEAALRRSVRAEGRMRISRRLLMGGVAAAGALAWGGTSLARMARGPSGPKDLGRIGDLDGKALARSADAVPEFDPALPWSMKGGTLNDASGLSRTPVYGVVEVASRNDVARALAFARDNGLKVSVAAVRHSMGGHAFDDHALVLDMRRF